MLSAESILQSRELLIMHSSLYIYNSAESVSCTEQSLEKEEVAAVAGTSFAPLALLPSLMRGGSEMHVTAMYLINL